MKIDFNQLIVDLDGEPIENSFKKSDPANKETGLTLGDACTRALSHAKANEKGDALDIATGVRFYTLATLIKNSMKPGGDQPDLVAEDIASIKAMLPGQWLPIVAGQAALMLEGKIKPPPQPSPVLKPKTGEEDK
jgi:hypothetical protein